MSDPILRLALAETPAEQADALAAAPDAVLDAARWTAARRVLRQRLAADLPAPDLLVLRALSPADLTGDEQARLDAANLDAALARHPGLDAVAERVSDDVAAFDAAYAEHEALATEAPTTEAPRAEAAAPRRAADRAVARSARPARSRWVWRTVAAMGVVAFAAVLATVWLRNAGFETITADRAQTVALADGSTVELALGSVLAIPEPGSRQDARQARLLSGEALFRITHDAARPFAVETPNADVTVLGTVFAVDVEGAETERVETQVTLLTGRVTVALRGSDAATRLAPGQTSTVAALTPPTPATPADRGAALAFLPDLRMRGVAAGAVARRLGTRFGVEITLRPALADEPVSAVFHMADGPAAAARALALALGATVQATGDAAFRID